MKKSSANKRLTPKPHASIVAHRRLVSPLQMWAVIIKSARSEWMHWQTVERTKKQAWQKYLDQWNPEYRHVAENNRRNKMLRLAKVTVAEWANE